MVPTDAFFHLAQDKLKIEKNTRGKSRLFNKCGVKKKNNKGASPAFYYILGWGLKKMKKIKRKSSIFLLYLGGG